MSGFCQLWLRCSFKKKIKILYPWLPASKLRLLEGGVRLATRSYLFPTDGPSVRFAEGVLDLREPDGDYHTVHDMCCMTLLTLISCLKRPQALRSQGVVCIVVVMVVVAPHLPRGLLGEGKGTVRTAATVLHFLTCQANSLLTFFWHISETLFFRLTSHSTRGLH